MSELKVILATPHPKMKNACDGAIEVCLKSEADKVIADLEESHKKEVEQLLIEIVKLNEGSQNLILDNYLKDEKLRHSKYKRCLSMEKLCHEKWLVHYFAEIHTKLGFYDKWEKRWFKIAEQFKEAKEALELVKKENALCKEAK